MKFIVYPFFLALVTVVPVHAKDAWKSYVNERFGFSLNYPATLVASPDPNNGAGREYHTPGKEFSITTPPISYESSTHMSRLIVIGWTS
jgi:hypothetical protein